MSGSTLAQDLPLHKEGSEASLACGHMSLEELRTASGHPLSPGHVLHELLHSPLAPTGLHKPRLGACGPKVGLGEPGGAAVEEDARLLLKMVSNGQLGGKGDSSSNAWLHARSKSQAKPAASLLPLPRGEHHPAAFLLFLWVMHESGLLSAPHHSDAIRRGSF